MNILQRAVPLVVCSTSLCLVSVPTAATTTYRVEEVQTLPGSGDNRVRAIGPTGVMAGSAVAFDSQAVLWDEAGNITDLTSGGGAYAVAIDVNAHNAAPVIDSSKWSNFLWSNGGLQTINAQGVLNAINDAGVIAGWRSINRKYRAFTWRDGVTTYLDDLPNSTENMATAINNREQVVGVSTLTGGASRAVIWNQGVPTDLGTLPGFTSSSATAISDAGHVVGYVNTGSASSFSPTKNTARAFLWRDGSMRELSGIDGTMWTIANSVNSHGHAVGYSLTGTHIFRDRVAFVNKDGVVQNLSRVLDNNECYAVDINDAGQIAVNCGSRAFRLTPTTPAADVGVQLATSSKTVTQGAPFTYILTASNSGSLPASGVSVNTLLPSGVELNSVVASQGNCSGTSVITCALGDLAGGDAATVRMTVTPTVAGTLINSASVATNEADANQVNQSATLSVPVQVLIPTADVTLGMSASATRVRVGRDLGYSITVSNKGPQAATDVRVTDNLPAGTTLVSTSTSLGSCATTTSGGVNTVVCSLGNLAQNASATVNIVVKPTVSGQLLSNTARVNTASSDPVASNNTATVNTTTVR